MNEATELQETLDYALKMYGEAAVKYAQSMTTGEKDGSYDNMCFWQNQVWQCAKAKARGSF